MAHAHAIETRAERFDYFKRDAQAFLLGFVRIGDETAIQHG